MSTLHNHNFAICQSFDGLEIGRVIAQHYKRGVDADWKPATPEQVGSFLVGYLIEHERLLKIERRQTSRIVAEGKIPAWCDECGCVHGNSEMINTSSVSLDRAFICEECMLQFDWDSDDEDEKTGNVKMLCLAAAHFRKRAAEAGMHDQRGVQKTFKINAHSMLEGAAYMLDDQWDQSKPDRRYQVLEKFGYTWCESDDVAGSWCFYPTRGLR